MNINLKTFIGARIIKTALAVGIAMYLADLFNFEPKLFAGVSALMNIQPSVFRSFRNAGEQVLCHILSVSLALFVGYFIGAGPFEMIAITIIVIALNNKLGMQNTIGMGVVAALFVLDAPQDEFLTQAISRSYVIFLGLAVALIVNLVIVPPKYKDKLLEVLADLNEKTVAFFEQSVNGFINLSPMDDETFNKRRAEIKSLLRQGRKYLELSREQIRTNDKELDVYERYIDYNANLYHSSRDIHVATGQRIAWRMESGNPKVSAEFKDILKMLGYGMDTFQQLNKQLYQAVLFKENVKAQSIDESFWEELSLHVDKWHENIAGARFLHAFMFFSVVANDIKLACKGIKDFLRDLNDNNP
ncbi:FUSC family protein [Desulfofalx alkaliphila]|uniref:FUSC family protein n=1 Tax=Desulfofalx alkaliphila TaxID=105483 RepID=UPI0004E2475F|nr:aromatic acid exporter family protein [Desulfofalx alkaliphila]